MTFLYLCRHAGDEYMITKMDNLGNVESSYLCTQEECTCPAGVRPTCRHRQMLPKFLSREAVNTQWAFDYDRGGWVQTEWGPQEEPQTFIYGTDETATEYTGHELYGVGLAITQGAVALSEALGEPEASLKPPSPSHIPRRF